MTGEQFKASLKAQPFRPFVLWTEDGRRYRVDHPDMALLTPGGRTVVVVAGDDSFALLDLPLIERMESSPQGRPSVAQGDRIFCIYAASRWFAKIRTPLIRSLAQTHGSTRWDLRAHEGSAVVRPPPKALRSPKDRSIRPRSADTARPNSVRSSAIDRSRYGLCALRGESPQGPSTHPLRARFMAWMSRALW